MQKEYLEGRLQEYKDSLRGWWILLIWLLIEIFTAQSFSFHKYLEQLLNVTEWGSINGPPIDFVRGDFITGLASLVAAALSCFLALVTWKRYPLYSGMIQWFTIMGLAYNIFRSLDIFLRCEYLFNNTMVKCPWPTFDDYLWNGYHQAMFYLFLLAGLFYAKWIMKVAAQRNKIIADSSKENTSLQQRE